MTSSVRRSLPPERPDNGRIRKSAGIIAVFVPKILLTFTYDSIWALIVGGDDPGVDIDLYLTEW
jgi:hypothetical protein